MNECVCVCVCVCVCFRFRHLGVEGRGGLPDVPRGPRGRQEGDVAGEVEAAQGGGEREEDVATGNA